MSNGIRDAFSWLFPVDTSVKPDDPRWTNSNMGYFPWDDDDETTVRMDQIDWDEMMKGIKEKMEQEAKDENRKSCLCGAWATSFPNFHSTWCPNYRPFT